MDQDWLDERSDGCHVRALLAVTYVALRTDRRKKELRT